MSAIRLLRDGSGGLNTRQRSSHGRTGHTTTGLLSIGKLQSRHQRLIGLSGSHSQPFAQHVAESTDPTRHSRLPDVVRDRCSDPSAFPSTPYEMVLTLARRVRPRGNDSCDLSSLSTPVDAVGQRVIPPRVAFNRLVAVQAPEWHSGITLNRPSPRLAQCPATSAPTLAPIRCPASSASGEASHRSNRRAVLRRARRHRTSRTSGRKC